MLTCVNPPPATPPEDDDADKLRAKRSRLIQLLWRVDALRARLVAKVRAVDKWIRETRRSAPPSE